MFKNYKAADNVNATYSIILISLITQNYSQTEKFQ